jgi:DNA-binding SARP family transcriptional activator
VSQQLYVAKPDGRRGPAAVAPAPTGTKLRLQLLGGFRLEIAGTRVGLPTHAKRVLIYLAVNSRAQAGCARRTLADRLWSEADGERGQASLRTALWRIRQADRRLLAVEQDSLRLGSAVQVDLHSALDQAGRLLKHDTVLRPADTVIAPLSTKLLPGWDEDWLLLERERVHELQLHALDALAARLRRLGCYSEAVNAALTSIAIDPLRESARSELIVAHLAEGNVAAAHRQFEDYATALWAELRLRPSPTLATLLTGSERGRTA